MHTFEKQLTEQRVDKFIHTVQHVMPDELAFKEFVSSLYDDAELGRHPEPYIYVFYHVVQHLARFTHLEEK